MPKNTPTTKPPSCLQKTMIKRWPEFVAIINDGPGWRDGYALALAMMLNDLHIYELAQKQVNEEGITSITHNGCVVQHPAVGTMNAARTRIDRALSRMGLDPKAVSQMKIGDGGEDELDEWENEELA